MFTTVDNTVDELGHGINSENLPRKQDLLNNAEMRQDFASSVLSMSSEMKDSDAFWRRECQEWIGSLRYLGDPPVYRERIPMEPTMFRTRAMCYNHHPAVHSLFPGAEEIKQRSSVDYCKYRFQNVLQNATIIQFVGAFMAELDITVVAPVVQGATGHAMRNEWGPNANPHWHSMLMSETLSTVFDG